jgi:hypothetical protein
VAVDPSDDTAIVAASDGFDGVVELTRVDRYGNEVQRRTYTGSQLPVGIFGGPFDIATCRYASSTRSDVMLGFHGAAVLLNGSLGVLWIRRLSDLFPADYPYSEVEVEICNRNNFYFVTTGVEYFNGQDLIRNYDRAGVERWAIDVREGRTYGSAPAYTSPLGVVRPDHFALRCNEQELPDLSFHRSEAGLAYPREIRAVTFQHSGAVFRKYRGTFPNTVGFVGAAGVDAGVYDFLALGSRKFSLRSRSAIAWTSF